MILINKFLIEIVQVTGSFGNFFQDLYVETVVQAVNEFDLQPSNR